MRKAFAFIMLALCLIMGTMGTAVDSHAHNRAGLEKITLYTEVPTPDDFAYYLEANVNKRVDENGKGHRYFLMDFEKVTMDGDKAIIDAQIFDQKTGKTTPETLYLMRNKDNSWNHIEADGTVIEREIYTMVEPDKMLPYKLGGLGLLIVLLLVANVRRMLKKKKAAPKAAPEAPKADAAPEAAPEAAAKAEEPKAE